MSMGVVKALEPSQLYQSTDPEQFTFKTTAELPDLKSPVGQPRAVEAMQFGTNIQRKGFNVFALGPTGVDKQAFVRQFFEREAQEEPVPCDWCYINNFDTPHKPWAIQLPAGTGIQFRKDMEQLVGELQTALLAAFEGDEYQNRRQAIGEEFKERQEQAFKELQEKAQEQSLAVLRTPAGLAFAPVREGEVLSREEVEKLTEEQRAKLEQDVEGLQEELQRILRQLPTWQREMRDKVRQLDGEVARFAVGGLIDELVAKYTDHAEVGEYLEDVRKDVVENASDFLSNEQQEAAANLTAMLSGGRQPGAGRQGSLRRYQVNLIVDHSDSEGAPVVYEDNPGYQNLIGRVEHMAQMGALLTDFNLIKPGALHQANGGYLILDARKLLLQPYAWEGLKRALQAGQIRIESPGQMLSLISTVSLEPEPIPLNVKVGLVGEPLIYYLLWQADPDFAELFKVAADFEDSMDRNHENQELYARLIATLARQEELRPFDRGAVARVIEHSARSVGDREKMSTHMRNVADLLAEADFWAGKAEREVVGVEDVQKAIDARIYRFDRLRERAQEAILRETVLIDTDGAKVGQVNGLSVAQLGEFSFGRPTRITAQVRMGKGEVIDIEREVELGGPIHSKGVLILSGFLGGRYAAERPLSLSASLVFEQSYGGVEGDSASSAELYALLSAISQVPIKQSFAVTGSVNQHGQVQAIGGVNEKIEGFFDVCSARGLTGEQGVLIPASNVKHLMLREDVVKAVADGKFHIYPVERIDQGIELLSGIEAGERDERGHYPEGSINNLVERRLAELAEKRAASAAKGQED
jgi:lon-related putative ATP-dependent protease